MKLNQVPNALCFTRLAMIPVLWVFALTAPAARVLFTVLLAFAFLTDFVDGIICRRYGLASSFGAKFDRMSDDLLTLNAVGWLYLLRRELFVEYWPLLAALLLTMFLSVALQYWRFRRKVAFHLYAGKAANWTIAVFACYTLLFGPLAWFVYLMAAIVGYALIEEIVLVLTREQLDEHVTSMLVPALGGSQQRPGAS